MLYDVYKLSPGVYRYVGPYRDGDRAAHALMEGSKRYVMTVNNLDAASDVAHEDHAESNATGGVVSRTMSVAEATAAKL
jgi:hypothetical protein